MTKKRLRIWIIIVCIITGVVAFVWWENSKTFPVEYGISFNQNYATDLGLDWKKVYSDMLTELNPKYIRIAAMWSEVEPIRGEYDFADVDYMMNLARDNGTQVILVVGQKAPRWPECHVPEWVNYNDPLTEQHLLKYIGTVVNRYRGHEALEFWQVENEPYIRFRFGECEDYNEAIVSKEIEHVQFLDPEHPVILTDSGELSTWRRAISEADYFGTTLYRIVRMQNGLVFTYDWVPAVFYRWKAQFWGQDLSKMFVSELQAEPWFTSGDPLTTSIERQEKTMNPKRLQRHLEYVKHIGVSRAYLWGVEWWYFMKEEHGEEQYWEIVHDVIAQ